MAVDLNLASLAPLPILYQGTHDKALKSITKQGLSKMKRHHVHLSSDRVTAIKVGRRRGKAVILEIAAGKMAESGFKFYRVDKVSAEYIKLQNS